VCVSDGRARRGRGNKIKGRRRDGRPAGRANDSAGVPQSMMARPVVSVSDWPPIRSVAVAAYG
jgi:hypothetical protein